jgi:hypothetical protein
MTNFIHFLINLKGSSIFAIRFKIISYHFHKMFTNIITYVFNVAITFLLSKDPFKISTLLVIRTMPMFFNF